MSIVIVDYGMGNLRSVLNALTFLGADVKISDKCADIGNASKLILPGVGGFRDAIEELNNRNLADAIKKYLKSGRIYLGICLGLQLLFEESEEGNIKGFGVFKGCVKRFEEKKGLKIPHMGWNKIKSKISAKSGSAFGGKNQKSKIMDGIADNSYFYFVHSYYAAPEDKKLTYATTEYGGRDFTSMVVKDNIYATQFHPERSQHLGLKFLKNFVELR